MSLMTVHTQFPVSIQTLFTGKDIVFIMTGGVEHTGAVSTAYFTDSGTIDVQTISLPHHREADLTEPFAKQAAEKLQRNCTVVMGIHYDDITREELGQIVHNARQLFLATLDELASRLLQ
jgi:gallate decarboxylase subunit D